VHGARPADVARLSRIARGHPLALMLAAAGVAEHPELALEDAATTRVIAELTRLYLEDVPDPGVRRTLEAASVVRRVTEPLLGAMLPEVDVGEAMAALLRLPFIDAGREGLVVHEAVREPVQGFLHSTNPVRHRRYRRAAWRQLRNEVNEAPPTELWRYTADMLYLIDNPVVREAFFPSRAQPLAVEPARPADEDAMVAIGRCHEGPEAASLLGEWWSVAPETFSVIRDRDGIVTGFFSLLNGTAMRPPLVRGDPVAQAWSRHLRQHPLAAGQQALGLRRWLAADRGEAPGAVQAACWLDVKRAYMALRPALRRIYVVVQDVPAYWPVVERLGFRPIAESPVCLDGVDYTTVALDFGPGSVDGWLASLVADELGVADEPTLDEDARELSVQGQRVALTPLEFALLQHLRQREGRTVSRPELLREVWGTEFTGGSNVVDAVVRSLRHKLGPAAIVVETVRGSGYRLRPDWRAHLS
jgi:Transcriptional regulatory protein, C terminal